MALQRMAVQRGCFQCICPTVWVPQACDLCPLPCHVSVIKNKKQRAVFCSTANLKKSLQHVLRFFWYFYFFSVHGENEVIENE